MANAPAPRVLVAGASGSIGSFLLPMLAGRGAAVRAMARRAERLSNLPLGAEAIAGDALEPASLARCCDGIDVVFSAVGASVAPAWSGGRRSFHGLDVPANRNLIAEARRAGVRRFVYLAAFVAPGYERTRYVAAHERVVEELRASGMSHGVVRATGFFGTLAALVDMARSGPVPVIGDGSARTNPVHEADVAEACAEAILSQDPALEIAVGGPEVLSRRAIAEKACAAAGVPARLRHVPPGVLRAGGLFVRPFHPRLGDVLAFGAAVTTADGVAPCRGRRSVDEYFAARAARGGGRP